MSLPEVAAVHRDWGLWVVTSLIGLAFFFS
jgi:hypothetical protein